MKFAKIFENKRLGQVIIMKKQTELGAPELRFFFQPEGFGVCEFAIGFNDQDASESRFAKVYDEMTPQIAYEIIDGYLKHMTAQAGEKH
ncbi:hypothetical protein UFOVP77_35 [uncultured Caudovirales phage]|uniref:Uncharacterized protein n=1 Tax=uncultured Caudovirales phage TaxID=2100421 RepID=A0A6J5L4T6_9CAUD|nr:hypothetical protein UFOVP77_35 [uncultured Caudovirales phage]